MKKLFLSAVLLLIACTPQAGEEIAAYANPGFPVSAVTTWLQARSVQKTDLIEESWYGLYLFGSKMGWFQIRISCHQADGKTWYRTINRMLFAARRGGDTAQVLSSSDVLENTNGKVELFHAYQKQGPLPKLTRGYVKNDTLYWETRSGDRVVSNSRPWNPETLPPYATELMIKKRGLQRGTIDNIKLFVPDSPEADVVSDIVIGKKEAVKLLGETRNLIPLTLHYRKPIEVKAISWMNEERIVYKMSLMETMILYRLPPQLAKRPGKVKDFFTMSVVPINRPFPEPRSQKRLRFRLILKRTKELPPIPTGVRQNVIKKTPQQIDLDVQAVAPSSATNLIGDYPKTMGRYLKSTPYLQSDAPAIRSAARSILKNEKNALAAVRTLERWVAKSLEKKNFKVSFASALETLTSREGDCTEHAVLLAALCRASGIPSRVATGLVYLPEAGGDGGFLYHMWTEAWLGRWIALDATLPGPFVDATHITLARSALEDSSSIYNLFPLISYIGNLRIELLP